MMIAAFVSVIARRLKVPYTVGLTITGIIVSRLPFRSDLPLTRELIFDVFLPPLIFEAAIQIEWKKLRRDLESIMTLAIVGVAISAAIMAAGARWLLGWDWAAAILIAILLSATDPVAVIGMFKELKVGGRLQLLIEAESLLNDGTVAVFFAIAAASRMAERRSS